MSSEAGDAGADRQTGEITRQLRTPEEIATGACPVHGSVSSDGNALEIQLTRPSSTSVTAASNADESFVTLVERLTAELTNLYATRLRAVSASRRGVSEEDLVITVQRRAVSDNGNETNRFSWHVELDVGTKCLYSIALLFSLLLTIIIYLFFVSHLGWDSPVLLVVGCALLGVFMFIA